MQRLSGIDAMFLALDTPTTRGVIGQLLVYDRTGAADGASRAAIRGRLLDRIDAIPPLRWRLREHRLRPGVQYWDDDPAFDIDDHIHDEVLAAPGTRPQLTAEVGRLMALPLAPHRPPWELHVIEGLEGGRVAHLFKIHHALIDGGLISTVTATLADDSPGTPSPAKSPSRGVLPRGRPHPLMHSLASTLASPARFASLQTEFMAWLGTRTLQDGIWTVPDMVARSLPGALGAPARAAVSLRYQLQADGRGEVAAAVPSFRPPKTPLNGALTSRRDYAFATAPLAEVKRIGSIVGVTVNDVVMALCATAVRRYLRELGKLPRRPLTAVVAVSTRGGHERYKWTNHVWMLLTPLPTDVEDPMQRLKAARAAMEGAKATYEALPFGLIQPASFFWPSPLIAAGTRLVARPAVARRIPVSPWNLTISNVRGPAKPIYITGARIEGNYPVTFLPPGTGLGIAVVSYVDELAFGLAACPDLVPGVERLTGHLTDALAELSRAVGDAAGDVTQRPLVSGDFLSAG